MNRSGKQTIFLIDTNNHASARFRHSISEMFIISNNHSRLGK